MDHLWCLWLHVRFRAVLISRPPNSSSKRIRCLIVVVWVAIGDRELMKGRGAQSLRGIDLPTIPER